MKVREFLAIIEACEFSIKRDGPHHFRITIRAPAHELPGANEVECRGVSARTAAVAWLLGGAASMLPQNIGAALYAVGSATSKAIKADHAQLQRSDPEAEVQTVNLRNFASGGPSGAPEN